MAYLEEIQPPLSYDDISYPSFSFRLLVNEIRRQLSKGEISLEELRTVLVNIAERTLGAKTNTSCTAWISCWNRLADHSQTQIEERYDTLDTYFEGIGDVEEG